MEKFTAKAAIMIKQMTDSLGEVDYVCYWHASDIFAGDFDAKRILNGACGLISSDGFCKCCISGWRSCSKGRVVSDDREGGNR